jgi:thiol-disulfide isomerase/thioredoxin
MTLAVALIGALCLINLLLTLAVVRRLRQHGEQLTGRRTTDPAMSPYLPLGTPVPEFAATTLAGEVVSLGDLTGARSIVAFLAVNCPPCRMQLREIAEFAQSFPGGARRVLVVVSAASLDRAGDYIEELTGKAAIVVERMTGPTGQAFAVSAFPAIYALDERGHVQAASNSIRTIAARVRA